MNLKIKNNEIINNNTQDSFGGGIYMDYQSPKIYNNVIKGNSARWGGGFFLGQTTAEIYNNKINKNKGYYSSFSGLYIANATPKIVNNTIISNKDYVIYLEFNSRAMVINNIISGKNGRTLIVETDSGSDAIHLKNNISGTPSFETCKYSNGIYFEKGVEYIYTPSYIIDKDKGCIEFWWKLDYDYNKTDIW